MTRNASPLRAAVYGRESQSNSTSIDGQIRAGTGDVEDQGWILVGTFDDGGSASRFARKPRPDWERLVRELNAGAIDVVWVNEVSRGDRKLASWITVLDTCRERGVLVRVMSDDRTYDPRRSRDYKDLANAGVDAGFESDKISDRVTDGAMRAARAGKPPVGRTPFGYRRRRWQERGKDGRLARVVVQEPDPETAPIVAQIIEMVARSVPVRRICRWLAAEHGLDWQPYKVMDVARNEAYIGVRIHRKQGRNATGEPERYPGSWPPLVDEETFWAAQTVLDNPKRRTNANARPGAQVHLLSYFGTCPRGHRLRVRKGRYYVCDGGCVHIPKAAVEDYVETAVIETLSTDQLYEQLRSADASTDADLAAARAEVARLRARLEEFRQKARTGEVDANDFAVISAGLRADIAAAERRANTVALPPALRGYLEPGVDVMARWKADTVQARRDVIRSLWTVTVLPARQRKNVPMPERVRLDPVILGE